MAKRSMRVFVAFLCLLSLFLISGISAQGVDTKEYKQQATFWTIFSGVPILKEFLGYSAGLVCPTSDDGYHHASSYKVDRETGYYNCICDVCGWPFIAYETDLQQAYEAQVSKLPAAVVTSSGSLIRQTTWSDYHSEADDACSTYCLLFGDSVQHIEHGTSSFSMFRDLVSCSLISDCVLFGTWGTLYNSGSISFGLNYLRAPVSGYYSIADGIQFASIEYVDDSTETVQTRFWATRGNYLTLPLTYYNAGEWIELDGYHISNLALTSNWVYTSSHRAYLYTVPITIQPDSGVDATYANNSRPTSITGDYGIIGDNGQITKVENTTIVNETNNTYTNPSTGTTSTITEWTYDYSDRSYNVTTESGNTVTITYGDENITIQEGDTVYNVYYIVESSGEDPDVQPSPTPTPETCPHSYTSTVDREATCTFAGQITYTCSLCGYSYTESIPATGHAWDIKESVQTSYDEEGNLLQQGYTIYKCSVCGEEYKDETSTGPPGSGSGSGSVSGEDGENIWDKLGNLIGTVFGAIIDVISAVIGKILDALIALVEMIGSKLGAVVELVLSFFDNIPQLFSGFLAFLTAVFPFLPDDVMLLLTFGIAVVVFIGIIKALRR